MLRPAASLPPGALIAVPGGRGEVLGVQQEGPVVRLEYRDGVGRAVVYLDPARPVFVHACAPAPT